MSHQHQITAFVARLCAMASDPENLFPGCCSWGSQGDSFQIHDREIFETRVLLYYASSSNLKSFIRQLNRHGFRKERSWSKLIEYKHPHFQRDRPDLLAKIRAIVPTVSKAGGVAYSHTTLQPPSLQQQLQQQRFNALRLSAAAAAALPDGWAVPAQFEPYHPHSEQQRQQQQQQQPPQLLCLKELQEQQHHLQSLQQPQSSVAPSQSQPYHHHHHQQQQQQQQQQEPQLQSQQLQHQEPQVAISAQEAYQHLQLHHQQQQYLLQKDQHKQSQQEQEQRQQQQQQQQHEIMMMLSQEKGEMVGFPPNQPPLPLAFQPEALPQQQPRDLYQQSQSKNQHVLQQLSHSSPPYPPTSHTQEVEEARAHCERLEGQIANLKNGQGSPLSHLQQQQGPSCSGVGGDGDGGGGRGGRFDDAEQSSEERDSGDSAAEAAEAAETLFFLRGKVYVSAVVGDGDVSGPPFCTASTASPTTTTTTTTAAAYSSASASASSSSASSSSSSSSASYTAAAEHEIARIQEQQHRLQREHNLQLEHLHDLPLQSSLPQYQPQSSWSQQLQQHSSVSSFPLQHQPQQQHQYHQQQQQQHQHQLQQQQQQQKQQQQQQQREPKQELLNKLTYSSFSRKVPSASAAALPPTPTPTIISQPDESYITQTQLQLPQDLLFNPQPQQKLSTRELFQQVANNQRKKKQQQQQQLKPDLLFSLSSPPATHKQEHPRQQQQQQQQDASTDVDTSRKFMKVENSSVQCQQLEGHQHQLEQAQQQDE